MEATAQRRLDLRRSRKCSLYSRWFAHSDSLNATNSQHYIAPGAHEDGLFYDCHLFWMTNCGINLSANFMDASPFTSLVTSLVIDAGTGRIIYRFSSCIPSKRAAYLSVSFVGKSSTSSFPNLNFTPVLSCIPFPPSQ